MRKTKEPQNGLTPAEVEQLTQAFWKQAPIMAATIYAALIPDEEYDPHELADTAAAETLGLIDSLVIGIREGGT